LDGSDNEAYHDSDDDDEYGVEERSDGDQMSQDQDDVGVDNDSDIEETDQA